MHFRSFRSLSAALVASSLLLGLASTAGADGDKDKEAMKLHDQAINDDYLNADFPKAEKKLQDAIKKCGATGCSPGVLGKLHVSLGTILGAGENKLDKAKEEFILALKADPAAALDPSLTNADLDKAFAEAKKSVGGAAGAGGAGGAAGSGGAGGAGGATPPKKPPKADGGEVATHTPPPESVVNTPLPIYIEPSDEVPLSKVTLRYKPFGATQYKSVDLPKLKKGFGGIIPCAELTTTGDLKYFFALTDDSGESAGTLGSTKEPFKVAIKNEIEGDPPALPGQKPPDQCKDVKADCPPGIVSPDCPGTTGAGGGPAKKPWGASCEEPSQCESNNCLNGVCEEGTGGSGGSGGGTPSKAKLNVVSVGAEFDWLIISGKDDVCTPPTDGSAANYACFKTGTSTQFDGIIAAKNGTNGIQGGGAFGDVRLLAGFDRQILEKLPLRVGVRIGFAFGGSPSPDNPNPKNVQPALGFHPFHLEFRAGYNILGRAFEKMKPSPYVFVGGGLGQVNASVGVQVCDRTDSNAAKNGCHTKSASAPVDVDAYQVTGLGFVAFGGGATFGFTPNFGVAAELKMMLMVPTFGFVFAPTLGPVLAF